MVDQRKGELGQREHVRVLPSFHAKSGKLLEQAERILEFRHQIVRSSQGLLSEVPLCRLLEIAERLLGQANPHGYRALWQPAPGF